MTECSEIAINTWASFTDDQKTNFKRWDYPSRKAFVWGDNLPGYTIESNIDELLMTWSRMV